MKNKAVLITIMDNSGSMGRMKKEMGRGYHNLFDSWIRFFYKRIGLHFISHTTSAREVFSKSEFFERGEAGGTYISSGYEKALEILKSYDKERVDIYVIHLSDGDNWGEDNDKAVELAQKLSDKATVFQFVEIKRSNYVSSIASRFVNEVNGDNFTFVQIQGQEIIDDMIRNPLLFEQKMGNQNWLNKR